MTRNFVNDIDLSKVDDSALDRDDVGSAASELAGIASNFFLFGCALGIKRETMKQLQDIHRHKQKQGLQEVLDEYVLENHNTSKFGRPTWRNIVAAVSNSMGGNNHRLAKEIAANHAYGSITNPEQETVSNVQDVSTLQGRHGHHTTEPAKPTQWPHPHGKVQISASSPQLSQTQKRHSSSGKQSPEFHIGDTIHEHTGNPNQGNFTTSSNQGVISSQQKGQPSGKIFPACGRARGRRGSRLKCKNSQPPRPGSNQGTPPSRPPLGQGSRTTSDEQSQASTPVGYNSEGFARNSMISTSSAASIPSVATTPIGIVTAKFDQVRVNQTPPNDTTAQQPAVYTAPPPPQEQSQTLSESLTSFMSADSITESSLNSSTFSEPCFDDELRPIMYSPKTKSKMPKELFKEDVYESGYSKRDFQPSKYSQQVPEYQEPQSTTPPEATLDESRPINPQPPLNKSSHLQPKDYSDVYVPFQEYSAAVESHVRGIDRGAVIVAKIENSSINPQPPLNTSPHLQPKHYTDVYVSLSRSQGHSAGAPPPIPQVANLPTTQASVTSDPTQSQFSAAQSYQTGHGFFEATMALSTMDSLQPDELIETLSSNNTETLRTLQSEREETDQDTTHELGNSVVASVQSRSGMESYVKGIDRGAVAKIENSSLVSGTAKQNPNKPPKEATNSRAELSNPDQGYFPTPGLYDQQPQLHMRRSPHSIASSKSSQSVDRPYGAKEGAPPATMELVSMEDKVVLKPNNYSAPQINPDVEREDEPRQQEEPISMASTSSFESASFSGLHGPSSVTPSDVGGKTKHGQCSSMPHSLEASPSPRQQAKIGSQLKDEMRPSNSSVAGPNKEPMASTSSFLTPSCVGGKTEHAQCSSIPHSLEISASPQQQAKIGSQQQDEVRPSNWSMAGPNEVFGSSHIQQEIPPESEPILDYQTLLSGSHDGYRPCEDGGNIPFKSYEALQIRGEERYKKIKLQFALLSPRRGQRIMSDEDDDYPMKSHPHGLALIINNENFKEHDRREGTNVDETNLTMTLRYLGYNVEIHRDLATKDMIQLFEEVKLRDHSAYDSFICCILTHGASGRVFGVDSYPVLIETLTGKLCAASCPSLKGKPKIFFIQACRGKLKCFKVAADHGHHGSSDSEEDGDPDEDDREGHASQDSPSFNLKRAIVRSLSMEAEEDEEEDEEERIKADGSDLPDVTDFFFGFATPSGQVAWRDLDHGSWYISELCRQLCTYSVSKSLSDIMTKVHDSVGTSDVYRYGNYKQAPETTSRLRRKVFF